MLCRDLSGLWLHIIEKLKFVKAVLTEPAGSGSVGNMS